jgi:hypothetical protein
MQRYQLEHALRAASEITGEKEFIIVGSSALLGQIPEPPAELTQSLEVDLYPRHNPGAAEKLNAIGELSLFHTTHGFWLDPVGPKTATLPQGWEDRLVRVSNEHTKQAVGWCLELHDLAASKLFAGREKDLEFVRAMLRHKYLNKDLLRQRTESVATDGSKKVLALNRLKNLRNTK